MPNSQDPAPAWAGMVADTLLFAESRKRLLADDAALLVDLLIRRLWALPQPQAPEELAEAQWRLFGFRAMIGTAEHAWFLTKMSPAMRPLAIQHASRVCRWPLPTSYEAAMAFLERQAVVHRRIADIVLNDVGTVQEKAIA